MRDLEDLKEWRDNFFESEEDYKNPEAVDIYRKDLKEELAYRKERLIEFKTIRRYLDEGKDFEENEFDILDCIENEILDCIIEEKIDPEIESAKDNILEYALQRDFDQVEGTVDAIDDWYEETETVESIREILRGHKSNCFKEYVGKNFEAVYLFNSWFEELITDTEDEAKEIKKLIMDFENHLKSLEIVNSSS